jgi:hypothetical protein
MKRAGDLWSKICDKDAIQAAHRAARKGKAHYREVRWVDANEAAAIDAIYQSLVNKTYTTSPYDVEERFDGRKLRTIHKLPYYPDRIVQHALVSACEDVWRSSFIRDTFQSIVGRGTHDARKRVRSAIYGNPDLYALKFDIQKYYPSVNSLLMKDKIRRIVKCRDTLWLLDDIIDSCIGLPIGNYTSQYLGNLYLNDFDWWVKQSLQPKNYFRYCDDIVVLGNSAQECHLHRVAMFERLSSQYHLVVKDDWQVFPVDVRGLDFVGFVFTSSDVKLRKGIANGVRDKASKIKSGGLSACKIAGGAGSYWGWCKHGQGRALWAKHMTSDAISAIESAKAIIKEQQACR